MEVLGVASSIAGLVSLADVVAFKVSRFYTLAKGAHADIKALGVEIRSLYGVLSSLKLLASYLEAENPPPSYGNTKVPEMDRFHTCRENLDQLKRILGKFDLDSTKPLTRVRMKLLWPLKSTETKELVEKIARNKRDLSDALTADGLTTLVDALSSQKRLTETVGGVQLQLQQMAEEKAENEQDEHKRKVFEWCSKVNPYEKHRNAKSLRYPNTVMWFFDCPEYQKWTEESNGAIWLYGIPGAGKTILTSAIIEEAKILVEQNPKCALAYYYCEYRLPETQLLSNILGSLIRQICATSDEVFEELDLFYSDRNEKAKHPVLPTAEELDKLLRRLSTSFESVMIIVDGLDEISDSEELSKVLSTLSSLRSPADGSIKVIYTSRDEIDIKRHFSEFETISIAARGKDLELFVAAVVEGRIRNRLLRLRDPTLKGTIIDGIVSKANGMFQWAKCQLNYLCLLNNDKERKNALDTLPKDLFETYRRILNRVNNSTPGNRSLVQRTLRWIFFSRAPMSADTVAMAVAVKINSTYMDDDEIPDVDSILKWCSSLVRRDDASGTLSFSHFTVEEFLKDDQFLKNSELQNFHMRRNPSDRILAKVCLTYLNFGQFSQFVSQDEKAEDLPFFGYAARHWIAHAFVEIDSKEKDEVLFDLICQLFNPIKSPNFIRWLQKYWVQAQGSRIPQAAPTLHIAARLGFVRVCKWLLERDADVNFHDSIVGTPLICAVFYWDLNLLYKTRMPEMVRLLLEHGAKADVQFSDIRARGNFAVTPMSLALDLAEKDTALCSEVIRALLTANVLSSFEQSRFWEMVYRPSYSLRQFRPQHYDMIQLFKEILNHKAATSLNNATKSKVLAFLNRYGTDDAGKNLVSDMATEENLALSPFATAEFARSAAENGQTHLIKSLIEKKADPKVMSECLPISARSGIMEMLDLLLGYCLQNTTTILLNVQKAWINAINGGNVEILKIFLKHGIDVNMVVKQIEQSTPAPPSGRRTQTPETHSRPGIAHALLNGVLESVRFLASLPQTDLTIKVDGRNLLQLAALAHQKRGEMIDVLLDKGADPLERSDRGGTVLHYFLKKRQSFEDKDLDIVRRLIAAGCDIEATDDEGASLMHILFDQHSHQLSCFEELVALLFVERMVKVPRKDGTLVLPLAIEARHPAHIIRKLIPDDLSLWNAEGDRKFTPLHTVVIPRTHSLGSLAFRSQGSGQDDLYMIQTLEIILEVQGININAKDQEGNTPLLTAASNCATTTQDMRATIFKMLLEIGADINARNDNGDTVLHFLLLRGFNPGLLEILKFKPDVNATNNAGDSPLHVALGSDFDQSLAVRHLLEYDTKNCGGLGEGKIDCQIKNGENLLAIHLGAMKDQVAAIRIMYEMGHILNIDARTTKQETPLHFATGQDNPSTARLLVGLGADVNAADIYLVTPLHWAAAAGNEQLVIFLVERGASSIAENNSGFQPWADAAFNGHQDLMTILKDYADAELEEQLGEGKSMPQRTPSSPDNAKEQDEKRLPAKEETSPSKDEEALPGALEPSEAPPLRHTAMLKALKTGNPGFVQSMLGMEVNPNEPIDEKQSTALDIASSYQYNKVVKLLLRHGAKTDVRDKYGNTPLHSAALNSRADIIKTLFEAGAKLDARNFYMKTALHVAAVEGGLEAAQMLIELCDSDEKEASSSEEPLRETEHLTSGAGSKNASIGANGKLTKSVFLEMRDKHRETALLSALNSDNLEVAKFLVKEGANVFVRDRGGCNTLWHACQFADKELIETLFSRGVDITSSSYGGFGCLHGIVDRESDTQEDLTEAALVLINAGADLSSINLNRISPLHCACSAGNVAIIAELLSRMPKEELGVESRILGTPIYAAAFRGRLQVVKILLEKGVDVNLGIRGESPLEAATVEGHTEVAEFLEKHGAIRTKEFAWWTIPQGELSVKLNVDASMKVLERLNTLEEGVEAEAGINMRFAAEGEK